MLSFQVALADISIPNLRCSYLLQTAASGNFCWYGRLHLSITQGKLAAAMFQWKMY